MARPLSEFDRAHLLRKAMEVGLVSPEEVALPSDMDGRTITGSEITARFEALLRQGRLPEDFIAATLEADIHPTQAAALPTQDGLAASRDPGPGGPDPLATFPMAKGGRYVPLAHLGDGGMGRVFKAYDVQLKRVVALKFLWRLEREPLERFLLEARAQAQIEHPHVCPIYSVGQEDAQPYLAMRFIDGPNLRQIQTQLTLEQKVGIIRDVAEALHACHRHGIVHRDVKPSNIMLERSEEGPWRPFIMDFGLAREIGSDSLTVTGVIVGTPVYCSPEQAQGRIQELDRRTDVYSLGATLYELLCDGPPFRPEGTLVDLVYRIVEVDPPRPRSRVPSLPRDLETILLKTLEKDPARRYDSARAFAEDLQRFLDGDPILARAVTPLYRGWKLLRKHRGLAAAATLSALLVVAAGTTWTLRTRIAAQSAQRFGREAEWMESIIFKIHCLPLHDVGYARTLIQERIDRIRGDLAASTTWAQPWGHLAIGRGLFALDRYEEARVELDLAHRLAPRDLDISQALGLTLARIYQTELEGLSGRALAERKKDLETSVRQPALTCLRESRGVATSSPAYVQGLLALVEDNLPEALRRAHEAQSQAPWLFEAWRLEAETHSRGAQQELERGRFTEAEGLLEASGESLRHALDIARSAPQAYISETRRRMELFQIRRDRGLATVADRDHALETIRMALVADPGNTRALSFKAAIHRQWADVLQRGGQDPGPDLTEALHACEAGLRGEPSNNALWNNKATILRNLATQEEVHGRDPRDLVDRAIRALEVALQRPQYGDLLNNNLGNCLLMRATYTLHHDGDPTSDLRRAVTHFRRAWELKPWVGHLAGIGEGLNELALYQSLRGGDPEPVLTEALAALDEGIRFNPNSYQTHQTRAEVLLSRAWTRLHHGGSAQGDPAQARAALEEVQKLNPRLAPSLAFHWTRAWALEAWGLPEPGRSRALRTAVQAFRAGLRGRADGLAVATAAAALACAGENSGLGAGLRAAEALARTAPQDPVARESLRRLSGLR
jgi:eukaryotic-like serine/threonine-protein kinase